MRSRSSHRPRFHTSRRPNDVFVRQFFFETAITNAASTTTGNPTVNDVIMFSQLAMLGGAGSANSAIKTIKMLRLVYDFMLVNPAGTVNTSAAANVFDCVYKDTLTVGNAPRLAASSFGFLSSTNANTQQLQFPERVFMRRWGFLGVGQSNAAVPETFPNFPFPEQRYNTRRIKLNALLNEQEVIVAHLETTNPTTSSQLLTWQVGCVVSYKFVT